MSQPPQCWRGRLALPAEGFGQALARTRSTPATLMQGGLAIGEVWGTLSGKLPPV